MDDIVFLYDQVVESVARLYTFGSARADDLTTHDDIKDDIDKVTELLAKRDLLVFAASMRSFIEATKGVKLSKARRITTSEIFISAGPPFFRDTKETISLYQCLSRILHAIDLRIFRNAMDYYHVISTTVEEFFHRLRAYEHEGGLTQQPEEPLIGMTTEQDKLTLVRLQYVITASCSVLGQLSDQLGEKKIFLQRDYR